MCYNRIKNIRKRKENFKKEICSHLSLCIFQWPIFLLQHVHHKLHSLVFVCLVVNTVAINTVFLILLAQDSCTETFFTYKTKLTLNWASGIQKWNNRKFKKSVMYILTLRLNYFYQIQKQNNLQNTVYNLSLIHIFCVCFRSCSCVIAFPKIN